MQVDVYTKDGRTAGQIELQDEIFGIEPNEHAMHMAVITHLARKRQGTHKAKARADVRGGGRKPWRQKGRGTARAGSIRSPLWKGGGTIFGPQPHPYNKRLPRKLKLLAKKSAFSVRLSEQNLMVVEDFNLEEIKTRQMVDFIKNLKIENESILILLPKENNNIFMSSRNIPRVSVKKADSTSTYDILSHKKVLLFKGAVETIANNFKN